MIIYLAALGNVSRDLHEAAALDGAGAVRRFFTVTVPGVRGTMMLVAQLTSVSALRVFLAVFILTNRTVGPGGQVEAIVLRLQLSARGSPANLHYSPALSVLVL